jgi:DNA-binding HxlR family transcriptional regulator
LKQVRGLVKNSSVTRVIDRIGDRTALRVLQEVFAGTRRFEALQGNTGVARNTLTNRLEGLIESRILKRVQYQDNPPRSEYHLTERGRDLYSVILHIDNWERRWSGDMAGPMLVHTPCGHELSAALACGKCRKSLTARDMTFVSASAYSPGVARRRHQRRARGLHTAEDGTSLNAADILGDWWSALVVSLAFFGVRRFKDMQQGLGIAPNILSSRLAYLTAAGILGRRAYQESPPRYEYRLTEKGLDLYAMNVAMMAWGDHWLSPKGYASLRLKHKACGATGIPKTVCQSCGREIELGDVHTKAGIPWAEL